MKINSPIFSRWLATLLLALLAMPAFAAVKTVNGIAVETSLPQATRGQPYSFQIVPTGPSPYTGPYTFSQDSGPLPSGLQVSSSGLVSGVTCSPNGSYSGIVLTIATVSASPNVSATFTGGGNSFSVNVTTAPPGACVLAVSGTVPSTGLTNVPFSGQVTATAGTAPYTYTVISGSLPPGVTLGTNGALSGIPTTAGQYTFSVQANDSAGQSGVASFTTTISFGISLDLSPATLPGGTSGSPYSQVVTASGGTAPYSFAVSAGTLPTGLSLATDGTLSGTPTAAGSYSFTIGGSGTGANGGFGSRAYTVVIAPGDVLAINPATLPGGTSGAPYSQTLTPTGGTAPYTCAITAGALPVGLSLAANGTLSGTTSAGSYTFTVTCTDVNGDFGSTDYTLDIAPAEVLVIDPATLPGGTSGAPYSQTLTPSGGTAPYTCAITSGALPVGLSLAANGTLAGTTSAGSYTFTVTCTDANGDFGTRDYTLDIAPGNVLAINPATLPAGTSGAPYSQTLTPSGGTAPYTCAITAGALPGGLSLAANGALSGTASSGTYTFTVTCTDANGDFGSRQYTVTFALANAGLTWVGPINKVLGEPTFQLPNPTSASAGAFTFTSSNASIASVSGRTVTLVSAGTVTLTATQAASGIYGAGSVTTTLRVNMRPDPTQDPGVVAGLQAQVDASVRFVSTQQTNIRDRLRVVRSGDNSSSNALSLNLASTFGPGLSLNAGETVGGDAMPLPEGWGWWTAGTINFGDRDPSGNSNAFGFQSNGISFGVDRRLGENTLLGVSVGTGLSDADFDADSSSMGGKHKSLSVYGLWRNDLVYLDGVLGAGRLDFDLRRYSALVNDYATANREGDQRFVSLTVGHEQQGESMRLATYGRLDASRTDLDGYRESGLGMYNLSYGEQRIDTTSLSLGAEGGSAWHSDAGAIRPYWMLEYRMSLKDQADVGINYVLLPNANDYLLRLRSYADDAVVWGGGLDFDVGPRWGLSLLYRGERISGVGNSYSVGLQVNWKGGAPAAPVAASPALSTHNSVR